MGEPVIETSPTRDEHNGKDVHIAAEKGAAATDNFGQSLVEFDKTAERKLRIKIDCMIVPIVSLLYLFCFIDRANIGNARLAGFEEELGLVGSQYNVTLSMFYVSYILFEVPCNILCKWMGPGYFLPLSTLLFGVFSLCTGFVHNLGQACGVRFLLGIFEAGMMPGISYYLSRWYRRSELTFRLSLFIVMAPLAGAFGGLLASAILTVDHVGSTTGWRMIFVVEGIVTIFLGLVAFFILTDRPETARWLTQEEKDLAVARVKSERVAQTTVLDRMDNRKLWLGVWNPVILSNAMVFLFNNITVQGLAFFTPTIVKSIYPEYSTIMQQLYTVPPYVVGAFFTLLIPGLSWRFDNRQVPIIFTCPLVMVGYIMFLASKDPTTRYAATFLGASSAFALGPLAGGQAAANVVSDTSRTMALATNMMFGNVGGLIATWSYLPWDEPDYPIGNGLNLAAATMILVIATATWFLMHSDNKKRDSWDADEMLRDKDQMEIESMEWKHPGFRWRP